MTDLVKLYNPANAELLTPEQLEGLQKLDSNQIKELAKAYPNTAIPRAYLLIGDSTKPIEKQLLSLSTFENLWNLREKNAQRQYVPYAFKGTFKPKSFNTVKPRKSEVLDLSDVELMRLPGFKNIGGISEVYKAKPKDFEEITETVPVKKIRKVNKAEFEALPITEKISKPAKKTKSK